ncbi:MAG TPA: hypothetical protein VFP36_01390 [Usitatibacter sp.]|nr:hypothetical protein [Usitatibacter sp.]
MTDVLKAGDFQSLDTPLELDVKMGGALVAVALTVESVRPLPPHRLRDAPFSMILCGPCEPALPQATYALRHPRLGTIEVFLVPVAQDATTRRYEATFN